MGQPAVTPLKEGKVSLEPIRFSRAEREILRQLLYQRCVEIDFEITAAQKSQDRDWLTMEKNKMQCLLSKLDDAEEACRRRF